MLKIVTVVKNDLNGLEHTCTSINNVCSKLKPRSSGLISHLIIDGGSSDGTLEFAEKYAAHSSIEASVFSEKDQGIYDAMNKGILKVSSKYVVFLNSGDLLYGTLNIELVIERLIGLHEKKVDFIAYSSIKCFGEKQFFVRSRRVSLESPRLPTVHQSLIYRTSTLKKAMYDTNYQICGDYEQFSRVYSKRQRLVIEPEVFSVFYIGGISSQKPVVLFNESISISKKYFSLRFKKLLFLRAKLFYALTLSFILMKIYVV